MLMMGCHCSWQHPRLTNLRKYYLSPLHLTSNQSHQKFQRGANDETSSQFEVWGPTDGSRLVAWEELTLLPAFLPNHRSSSPAAQQNGRQGRKKRETRLPSSYCCLCWKISDYIWGRRRTWTRRAIHGSCGIRFWGSCLGNVADASPWDLLASLLDNKPDLTISCFCFECLSNLNQSLARL